MAFTVVRRQNSWTSDLNRLEEMQQHAKHVHIARWMLSKTSVYILKPYQEIG